MRPRHRGNTRVALFLAVGLATSTLASCGSGDAAATDGAVRAEYYAGPYGVRVGIQVGYAESREVTGARLVAGDESTDASLYPLDGTDPDGPTRSVALDPGERVSLEGTLLRTCTGALGTPVFEVVSQVDGAAVTELFRPANVDGYRRAVATWCARPFTMIDSGRSITLEGRHEQHVTFSNPGPETVVVTSEKVDDGSSSWEEARILVPVGLTEADLHGHGPPGCSPTPPWELGHVRADGRIIGLGPTSDTGSYDVDDGPAC
jgi:hypothetical protein